MNLSVTLLIVIVTCIVSILCFNNRELFDKLKHSPYLESKNGEWYRMLSSGFVHGSWVHLGINMFVLHEFGRMVESQFVAQYGGTMGSTIYLIAYLIMLVVSDLPTFKKHASNYGFASIGASGAVSGILFMFIMFFPWSKLYLYFAIPIPAIVFGVLYLAYSSWASKNQQDMIDHSAHFYGAVAGIVLMASLIPSSVGIFAQRFMQGLPF